MESATSRKALGRELRTEQGSAGERGGHGRHLAHGRGQRCRRVAVAARQRRVGVARTTGERRRRRIEHGIELRPALQAHDGTAG